jgi:hypothetical protein
MAGMWGRRAWFAGIVFVVALFAEGAISAGIPINQDDSAAKIARELHDHRTVILVAAYLSTIYAVAFVIYLCRMHELLVGPDGRRGGLHAAVLIGGTLMVALHGVSDVGIYGLLGGKLVDHGDQGVLYTLYLLTFALDSVGDVFGSVFLISTGLLLMDRDVLPRWLASMAIVAGAFLFLQGFGLGGVIATFGLVLDLIGFLLFLLFVLLSSILALRRAPAV